MTNETLKELLQNKQILDFETGDQDFAHGLRLVLCDMETGEMGVLAVEPQILEFDDAAVLWYSYQEITDRLAPSPEHFYSIATRVGPDYDSSNVPFLTGKQAGLF